MSPKRPQKATVRPEYARVEPGHVLQAQYYYHHTRPDSREPLVIVWGGREKIASDFEIRRRNYPYYILEYPLKGLCRFDIDGQSHVLKKGVLGGFNPGQSQHYRSDPKRPMEHFFVAFTGRDARDLMVQSGLGQGGTVPVWAPSRMTELFATITNAGLKKHAYAQQLSSCYLRTLLLEQAAHFASEGPSRSSAQETFQQCKQYISENFSTLNSTREAAETIGVDVRYMANLFKRFGETSPHDYLMQLKLNRAAKLLLNSDLPVHTVGHLVGFEDPYHFSRRFKALYGRSPKQFVQRHLEAQP